MSRSLPVLLALAVLVSACATRQGSGMSPEAAARAAEANTQLAARYLQEGDLQQGLRKARKAVEQDPDSSAAHMITGELYNRLDEPEDAERFYRKAIDLDAENSSARNNFGRFLCDRDDVEAALEQFEQAADNPVYDRPEVPLTNAGLCAQRNDREAEAEELFRRALDRNPRFPRALLSLAELRAEDRDYASARSLYNRYLTVARQNPASLWLGIRLADVAGDQDRVASYGLLLRQQYPESDEAQRLLEWERDGRL